MCIVSPLPRTTVSHEILRMPCMGVCGPGTSLINYVHRLHSSCVCMYHYRKGNSFDSGAVVHSFNCGDDPTYSHILQCSHTVSQTCNNELMSIKCSKFIQTRNALSAPSSHMYTHRMHTHLSTCMASYVTFMCRVVFPSEMCTFH